MSSSTPKHKPGPDADLASLAKADVHAHFDACVDAGVIMFDRHFVTETRIVDDIEFEFRISRALEKKPDETTSPLASNLGTSSSIPRPGSDLVTSGTEVASLGDDHYLALNGFSCYRPHYLILTNDGFRRQWEPLDASDFAAVHALLDSDLARDEKGEVGELLIFFNGGKAAGCSRVHKHVQAIPKESFGGDPWRNLDKGILPFSFFEKRFDPSEVPTAEISLKAYQEGLAAVAATVGSVTQEDDGRKRAPAHSVIMDRHRIVVIPRVAAGTGGLGANACGMLGMVWLHSQEMLQKWTEAGPQNILRAAGVDCLS